LMKGEELLGEPFMKILKRLILLAFLQDGSDFL
jgi:hypothetical protein